MSDNLYLWRKLCRPPHDALKKITGGRLSGKSDINPQWRMEAMTEALGPCGIGWAYEIVQLWTEPGTDGQVCAFARVDVRIREESGEWSAPVPGVGGSMLIEKEKNGLHTSDEAFKMAVTDALSVAFKALGVAADVYRGRFDGSKYTTPARPAPQDAPQSAPEAAGEAIPRHRTEDPPPTQQGPSKAAAVAYVAKTLNEAFPPEPGEDVELPEGQQRVIEALFPGHRTWERVQNATAKDLTDICRMKGGRSTLLDTIDNVRGAMLQEAEGSAHDPHPKPDAEPIRKAIKDTLTRLKAEDPAKARIVSDTILKALSDAGVTALSEIHDLKALEALADTIDRLEDAT